MNLGKNRKSSVILYIALLSVLITSLLFVASATEATNDVASLPLIIDEADAQNGTELCMLTPKEDNYMQTSSTDEHTADSLPFAFFTNGPEYVAAIAWRNYVNEYTSDIIITDNPIQVSLNEEFKNCRILLLDEIEKIPQQYQCYFAYTQDMIDKLHEIADFYGLTLYGELLRCSMWEDFQSEIANGAFISDSITTIPGDLWESGTFQFDGEFNNTRFRLHSSRKGTLDKLIMPVNEESITAEWHYENIHGDKLLLVQCEDYSYIITETETAYIEVRVFVVNNGSVSDIAEWLSPPPPISQIDLEHCADMINFQQLK